MREPRKGDLVTVRDLFPSLRRDIVRVDGFDPTMQWIEGTAIEPHKTGSYVCFACLCSITTLACRLGAESKL